MHGQRNPALAPDAWPHLSMSAIVERSLLATVSVAGKPNSEARDSLAEILPCPRLVSAETTIRATKASNSRLFGRCREISRSVRMRGGPGRCRNISPDQSLTRRCVRIRLFEPQRLFSLLDTWLGTRTLVTIRNLLSGHVMREQRDAVGL